MSKLKKERLNQMIENALSHNQESSRSNSDFLYRRLKGFIFKPKIYGVTFASLLIACVCIPPIVTSTNLIDVNKINDYVILSILDDMWIKNKAKWVIKKEAIH